MKKNSLITNKMRWKKYIKGNDLFFLKENRFIIKW